MILATCGPAASFPYDDTTASKQQIIFGKDLSIIPLHTRHHLDVLVLHEQHGHTFPLRREYPHEAYAVLGAGNSGLGKVNVWSSGALRCVLTRKSLILLDVYAPSIKVSVLLHHLLLELLWRSNHTISAAY